MADIKKTLELKAKLDLSGIKSELDSLKRDLGSITPKRQSRASFLDPELQKAKEIEKAYKQRERHQDRIFREEIRKQRQVSSEWKRQIQTQQQEKARVEKATTREINAHEKRIEAERKRSSRLSHQEQKRRQKELITDPARTTATPEEIKSFKRSQTAGKFDSSKENQRDINFYKNLRKPQEQRQSLFDPKRRKYVDLKEGETYSRTLGTKFRSEKDKRRSLKEFGREQGDKRSANLQADFQRRVASRMRLFQLQKKLNNRLVKEKESAEMRIARRVSDTMRSGISRLMGGGPFARSASALGGRFGERVGRSVASSGAAAGLAGRAVGAAGGAAGAVGLAGAAAYGGASFIRSATEAQRQHREELTTERFEQANLLIQNRVMEAPVRRRARKELGTFQRGAAEVTGMIKGLFRGDPVGGMEAAVAEEGRREADVAVQEAGPLIQAAQEGFMPNISTRLQTMAGGNLTPEQLNRLQGAGGAMGFGVQETNQRLQRLRGTLGGKAFAGRGGEQLLGGMMGLERQIGVGVGDQADFMEMMRGQGSTTTAQAFTQQKEIMKTAMSAGLDASKTSKFLETTSEYVSNNAGLARMDIDRISDSIATLSSSFAANAGRADITETDLRRARQTKELLRQESTATGGLAGLGNVLQIKAAAQEAGVSVGPYQFMALQNMSADATPEQVQQVMQQQGMSKGDAGKLASTFVQQRAKGTFETGAEAVGGPGAELAFSRQRGITTEAALNLQQARAGEGAARERIAEGRKVTDLPEGGLATDEFRTQMQRANAEIIRFNTGFEQLNTINDQYRQGLLELVRAFSEARKAFEDKSAEVKQRPQAPALGDGENDARNPRGISPALGWER